MSAAVHTPDARTYIPAHLLTDMELQAEADRVALRMARTGLPPRDATVVIELANRALRSMPKEQS